MKDKFTLALPERDGKGFANAALPPVETPANAIPGSVFFIGTATTVIRLGTFSILTDPNFLHAGQHADLGYGLTSKRLTDPAIEIQDLPPVDLCVLSHFHGDHWDEVAAAQLPKALPVLSTPQAAEAVQSQGFSRTFPLETWQSVLAERGDQWLRITALPARHGPPVVNFALPETMGSMLEWGRTGKPAALRLYISGDTLVYDDLVEISHRFPAIHLALLHLGGTRVMGVLVTMDGAQGVELVQRVNPQDVIPVHYNDYTVFKSPLADFLERAAQAGLSTRVHPLKHGETYSFGIWPADNLAE